MSSCLFDAASSKITNQTKTILALHALSPHQKATFLSKNDSQRDNFCLFILSVSYYGVDLVFILFFDLFFRISYHFVLTGLQTIIDLLF